MARAPREVEIKLELEPGRRRQFLRLPMLRKPRGRRSALLAIYFDTPDGELTARGMALRLRRDGDRWVQTLKGGGGASGGLHSRDEWEYETREAELDLAKFADTPLAALPDARRLHERLVEAFRVAMTRTTWLLGSGQHAVEVALDEGAAYRGELAAPISEVEIESRSGQAGAAFAVAAQFLERVPLRPSAITKAERGYRLWRGAPLVPRKARPVALDRDALPAQSARVVVAALLDGLQANEEGVLASGDPEFLHQYRIALRRLRSALRAHRRALEPGLEESLGAELRWITRMAGSLRDLDVLALATLPAMAATGADASDAVFLQRMEGRRRAARARLRRALASQRYARLVLAIARWLASPPRHAPAATASLTKFARKSIRRQRRRLLREADAIAAFDPAALHRVRIVAKRLRYTIEAFRSLLPADEADAWLATLGAVQDDLGRANDAAVATRLLGSLDAPPALAHFAEGWLANERRDAIGALPAHFDRLEKTLKHGDHGDH